jgi:PPOX class probable FMN-dependent enzyme
VDENDTHIVTTVRQIEDLYGQPGLASVKKVIDHLHPVYQELIKASPFAVLATRGSDGLDVSPRGDEPGFVTIEDEKTLLIPDRRGNNRADSLKNIVRNPEVSLLFLIPGVGETLRVNGKAKISVDPELIHRFAMGDKLPRSVMVIRVDRVMFQCSRAVVRSKIWDPSTHVSRTDLPSTGTILEALTECEIEAETYDRELPSRVQQTLY